MGDRGLSSVSCSFNTGHAGNLLRGGSWVPKAVTRSCNMMRGQIDPRYLFDYVISTDEDRGGNGDSKFLSRLQIDGELELRRLFRR